MSPLGAGNVGGVSGVHPVDLSSTLLPTHDINTTSALSDARLDMFRVWISWLEDAERLSNKNKRTVFLHSAGVGDYRF
jgi:hypothetical protein